jgi:hypothetical protein
VVLAYAVIALIALALLLRRDFRSMGEISYRGGWKLIGLIVGLFFLQAALIIYVSGQTFLQMAVLMLSQIALMVLILLNRHIPGAKVFALGIMLNILVMGANGGWMPVTPETYAFIHPERNIALQAKPPSSKNIILTRADTKMWLLSDIIRIKLPWRGTAISIGDLLLIVGTAQFIFQTTSPMKNQRLQPE